jgi:transcriptional regulator with XRE-family HTH domain
MKYLTIGGVLMELISQRLKDLRKEHGLTQQQVSELSGLAYKHYQSIEAGRRKQIWLETVERLAQTYGIEVHEFLAPKLTAKTKLIAKPKPSKIHYKSSK